MSNTKLRSAKYSINEMVRKTHEHSYATQSDMRHMLFRCIKDLHELGYKFGHIKGLQAKHIYALVEHWKNQGKNPGTIKNYMSKLRYTATLLNNNTLIKPDNATYGIDSRNTVLVNKAINQIDLTKCKDPYIRLSLEGQAVFGLRREESMKFTLSEAHHGNAIYLKPSWTKGGIGRTIAITNDAQKQWLAKLAILVCPGESLIPNNKSYKQHLKSYQNETKSMGICKLHGLRYAYAQRRYQELTKYYDPQKQGFNCSMAGGKQFSEMPRIEKEIDRKARQKLTHELGHSRLQITKIYCGK